MAQSSPATLITACPGCGTRYRLARDAVANGRAVQCAHCRTAWQPAPVETPVLSSEDEADRFFDDAAEEELDRAMIAAEREHAGLPAVVDAVAPRDPNPAAEPVVDPATLKKRQRGFSRRQDKLRRTTPINRMRRNARLAGFAALAVILGGGLIWRTEIVRVAPDLAGLYAALGVPVNVVGLEFRDVRIHRSSAAGAQTLTVDARIVSVADREVAVPRVVVTLLGEAGEKLYEWRVTPEARELGRGEGFDFEAMLTDPPSGATRVRLTFGNASAQAAPSTTAIEPETH